MGRTCPSWPLFPNLDVQEEIHLLQEYPQSTFPLKCCWPWNKCCAFSPQMQPLFCFLFSPLWKSSSAFQVPKRNHNLHSWKGQRSRRMYRYMCACKSANQIEWACQRKSSTLSVVSQTQRQDYVTLISHRDLDTAITSPSKMYLNFCPEIWPTICSVFSPIKSTGIKSLQVQKTSCWPCAWTLWLNVNARFYLFKASPVKIDTVIVADFGRWDGPYSHVNLLYMQHPFWQTMRGTSQPHSAHISSSLQR